MTSYSIHSDFLAVSPAVHKSFQSALLSPYYATKSSATLLTRYAQGSIRPHDQQELFSGISIPMSFSLTHAVWESLLSCTPSFITNILAVQENLRYVASNCHFFESHGETGNSSSRYPWSLLTNWLEEWNVLKRFITIHGHLLHLLLDGQNFVMLLDVATTIAPHTMLAITVRDDIMSLSR